MLSPLSVLIHGLQRDKLRQVPPGSMERDMERVEGMRARNVARTSRFLDARLRTIGIDTEGLDEQVRERRAQAERERVS